jgi:hypothetical protein
MTAQGGCSLRDCPEGAVPTGTLANFASFANYPVECSPFVPTPPTPAPPTPVPIPVAHYSGNAFSVVKYSAIGPLLSRQNVTIAKSGITQSFTYKVFEATSDVDFLYTFMTMFAKNTTTWVAGTTLDGAPEYRGTFQHNMSFTLHHDILYAILFDPSTNTGSLYSYPELYQTKVHEGNFFWNRAGDNKLYMQVTVPEAGAFGYDMHLQAFDATSSNYVDKGLVLLRASILP